MSQNRQLEKHLRAARSFMNQERFGDALAHFVFLSHAEPSFKMHFIEDFITALRRWTEILERHGEFDKVMVCYEQAIQLYPQSETILNNMGTLLFKLGCHDEAASCFRRALVLNPRCTQAKESLDSVANVLVERWHFRMLNDKKRNEAYKRAIFKAVSEGYDIVLDIGSGTGILSMFAVQAGAKKVYACEMSKTMYEMSLDVLAANQMKDSVEVIHKKSMDLKIGKEITSHVSLVVTETLDCGLLGEGIIPTVAHAWECLLQPQRKLKESSGNQEGLESNMFQRQNAKVIPAKACVYATVISCEAIRLRTRLNKTNISRVDLSSVYVVGGEKISLADVTTDNHVGVLEPYTTECLSTITDGYRMLTKTFAVAEYNFNDPKTFKKQSPICFKLPVITTGSVDAIAVWFDLYLDDEIYLNTGPCGRSTCWEQAVYPVYFHHLQSVPEQLNLLQGQLPVEAGDVITIGGEFSDDYLRLQCTGISKSQSVYIVNQETAPQSGCKQSLQKLSNEPEVETELSSRPTEMCEEQADVSTPTNIKNAWKFFTSPENGDVTNVQQVSNCFPSSTQPQQKHAPKGYDEKSPYYRKDNLCSSFHAFQGLSLSSENPEEKIDDISGHQTIVLPPSYMRQLNDDTFYSTYCEAIERAVSKVHDTYDQQGDSLLPDLTSDTNPPTLTINDASIKRDRLFRNENSLVRPGFGTDNTCRVLNVTHGPTLIGPIIVKAGASRVLMTGSDTSFSKVVKPSNCDLNLGSTRLEDVVSEGKIWDMLVADIVEPSGVLRQQVIEDIVLAKGQFMVRS